MRSLLCDFQIYCNVWQFLNAIQAHSTIVVQFECRHGSAYLVVLSLLESTIKSQLHPKQKQQLLVSPPLQSAAGVVWCSWVIARAARGEINFYYQQLQKLHTQPLTDSPLPDSPQSHNKPGSPPVRNNYHSSNCNRQSDRNTQCTQTQDKAESW